MKKSAVVPMVLLMACFVLLSLSVMSGNIDGVIALDPVHIKDPAVSTSININTATAEEIMLLPGIGENIANSIVSYRLEHGPFESIADLLQVKGIGAETFRQISPYITVGGSS